MPVPWSASRLEACQAEELEEDLVPFRGRWDFPLAPELELLPMPLAGAAEALPLPFLAGS